MQTTFPRLMLDHAAKRPNDAALREKEYGIWQSLTWAGLAKLVREMACGLASAGLKRGDHIVVVGENRPRLYAAMLASQALGAIPASELPGPRRLRPTGASDIGSRWTTSSQDCG